MPTLRITECSEASCIQPATRTDLIHALAYPLIVDDGTAVNVMLYMHAPERPAGMSDSESPFRVEAVILPSWHRCVY